MPRLKKTTEPPAATTATAPAPVEPKRDPVSQALNWVLSGASAPDIRAAIEATFPGEDAPAVLAAALKSLEDSAATPPEVLTGLVVEGTREIYRRAIELGDLPTALRALKQIADLAKTMAEDADFLKG